MAVTFVIGRAGTGKTHLCLDQIATALDRSETPGQLIFLVPEQASLQMERVLAQRAGGGGYWRAEVLSFTRLARRLFAQTGREPVMLRPQARALALRRVVREMDLSRSVFGHAAATPGFFAELDHLIEELLTERVTPADLSTAGRTLSDAATRGKVATIASIYGGYLDWLGEDRLDSALHLQLLRERIAAVPWLTEASLWVDGFAGFTGQEFATLTALARNVKDMTITLLMDPSPARGEVDSLTLFERTQRTYRRARAELDKIGVEIRAPILLQPDPVPRFGTHSALSLLERGLSPRAPIAAQTGAGADESSVRLMVCNTHRDELIEAARGIRRRILDSNGALRYRDFAVIARDLEPFAEIVTEVFEEYEIPFFLDRRRSITAHPLARMLAALLDAVGDDFSPRCMARFLRTGLTPLTRDQSETLENMIVRLQLHGAKQWGREVWESRADLWKSMDAPPTGEAAQGPLDLGRLAIFRAIQPLVRTLECESPPTGGQWAELLHEALESLGVRRVIEAWISQDERDKAWEAAETHRLAWDAVCEVLENLYEVLDDVPLQIGELRHIIGAAMADLTVGLAPPALDQVLVSSIERSRHPEIRYAWVFAFNEGVFPARPGEDRILSTAERRDISQSGLAAPTVHRDEAFGERLLAYIAFSRPADGLTISYATADDDGGELAPSPFLNEIKAVLPHLAIEHDADASADRSLPVSLTEFARGQLDVADEGAADRGDVERYTRLAKRLRRDAPTADRLDWLTRGRHYDNALPRLVVPAHAADEPVWNASPSELETYVQCPFLHFARYHVRLDAQRRIRPLSWDLGSIAHEVLADVVRRAGDEPGGVGDLAPQRWQALLDDAFARFKAAQSEDFAERNRQLAFMIGLLRRFLSEVVTVHGERYRRGCFEPVACELDFGGKRDDAAPPATGKMPAPPLVLRTEAGRIVELHGKIDRIDCCRTERGPAYLIYDYKTGVEKLNTRFLTGHRLQLFMYMLAQLNQLNKADGACVAGGLIAPWQPVTSPLDTKYFKNADAVEQLMLMYRPRGVFDESIAECLDQDFDSGDPSPVAAIQVKTDGSFYKKCDARPADEIRSALDVARRTVLQAAEGVSEGRIDVSPLVEKNCLACGFCEFAPVCRFDRSFNTPREASHHLPQAGQSGGDA